MLHILPGKSQEQRDDNPEEISYKKKKELQQKAQASRYALVHVQDCSAKWTQCHLLASIDVFQTKHVFSSHNWNTLFLGANVVADVMSEKYNTDKTKILESVSNCVCCSRMCSGCCCADKHLSVFTVFQSSKESLGVRMALGETQIVMETREFLVKNGVILDMFSKVCISMCQLSGLCLQPCIQYHCLVPPTARSSEKQDGNSGEEPASRDDVRRDRRDVRQVRNARSSHPASIWRHWHRGVHRTDRSENRLQKPRVFPGTISNLQISQSYKIHLIFVFREFLTFFVVLV